MVVGRARKIDEDGGRNNPTFPVFFVGKCGILESVYRCILNLLGKVSIRHDFEIPIPLRIPQSKLPQAPNQRPFLFTPFQLSSSFVPISPPQ